MPPALRPAENDAASRPRRRPLRRRVPRSLLRRGIAVSGLVALGALIVAPEALANFIPPKHGGSPNANQISDLYKIVLYVAAVVFVIVEGALAYSLYKFR